MSERQIDTGKLVSVIVPTRNSSSTLEACLSSVKYQSYPCLELIVVDNESSDGTVDLARRYASKVYTRGPERSAQRNYGARKSLGAYLLFIDSDQILDKEVVQDCINKAGACQAVIIPEVSIGEGFLARSKALERSCYIGDDDIEASRFFDKRIFEEVGGYDEEISAGGEDWDLQLRVLAAGGKIGRVDSFIRHLEGRITVRETVKRMRYYSPGFLIYRQKHSEEARRQFRLFRPAYRRNWRKLLRDPLHTAGFLFLKSVEFGAAVMTYLKRG